MSFPAVWINHTIFVGFPFRSLGVKPRPEESDKFAAFQADSDKNSKLNVHIPV
jgi:hypothetical protein